MVLIMKAVLCFALATSFQFTTCNDGSKDPNKPESRLTSGLLAEIENFPHQIALLQVIGDKVQIFCGGVLITPRAGLASPSCVRKNFTMAVRVGTAIWTEGGQTVPVIDYYAHSNYRDQYRQNDIAIIYFAHPVEFSDKVQPVALPPRSYMQTEGELVNASGWGDTRVLPPGVPRDPTKWSERLRYVTMRVLSQQTCRNVTWAANIYPGMICAESMTNGSESTCVGDGGGPLTHYNVLYGVTSWVSGCGFGKPSGYTNVFEYIDWIRDHVNE